MPPSQLVFEMINQLCTLYQALTPVVLHDMWIEDFFDLYVDCINYQLRQKNENGESAIVKNDTKPIPIKNGGWF